MRLLISIVGISVTSVKLCWGMLLALYKQQTVTMFTRVVLGREMKPITLKVFKVANRPLANADLWFHYWRGNFDLVGPKALELASVGRLTNKQKARFSVAPGLICPHQVRKKSGIAYCDEPTVAAGFALSATQWRRAQVLFAAAFQRCLGNGQKGLATPTSFSLFGVRIDNRTMDDAVEQVVNAVVQPRRQRLKTVAFVNADCVNKYVHDVNYRATLQQFDHVFADGIGMRLAARWHNARLLDNVNGTDMFPMLCERLARHGKRVFLYGGSSEVVSKTARRLRSEYPRLNVVGIRDGFSDQNKPAAVCQQINDSGADVLFIAKGAPLQERWLQENAQRLDVDVAIGVGGLFDFYSGHVSRAPVWLRELSLEWVWRLMMQPADKAKRYLIGNPLFLARVVMSASKHGRYQNTLEVI